MVSDQRPMSVIRATARRAGLLYLLMGLTAPIGLMVVPGRLIVRGDATTTLERIRASEWLFRVGITSELFHQAVAVFLVLALYRLFKPVSEGLARQLVALGALVSVPIMFVNTLNEIAVLVLIRGADFLSVFDRSQLDALAYLFLRLHGEGITVASIFWGLWLFPFALLVIRSGFIPRVLGLLLIVAGVGYLASAFASIVMPQLSPRVDRVALILEMGEPPIILWLLIRGAREGRRHAEGAGAQAVAAG